MYPSHACLRLCIKWRCIYIDKKNYIQAWCLYWSYIKCLISIWESFRRLWMYLWVPKACFHCQLQWCYRRLMWFLTFATQISVVATWIPTWTWHICTSSRFKGEIFVHPEMEMQASWPTIWITCFLWISNVSYQIVNGCSWNNHWAPKIWNCSPFFSKAGS